MFYTCLSWQFVWKLSIWNFKPNKMEEIRSFGNPSSAFLVWYMSVNVFKIEVGISEIFPPENGEPN